MIGYVTLGADDMTAAERFYSALLFPLGYRLEHYHGDLNYIPTAKPGDTEVYIKRPFNGAAASDGNGMMVAFEAEDQAQVRALHAAALSAGGSNEGAPGFRADYGADFYVGYLRDPQGNKIALYSSNSDAPRRDA